MIAYAVTTEEHTRLVIRSVALVADDAVEEIALDKLSQEVDVGVGALGQHHLQHSVVSCVASLLGTREGGEDFSGKRTLKGRG